MALSYRAKADPNHLTIKFEIIMKAQPYNSDKNTNGSSSNGFGGGGFGSHSMSSVMNGASNS